MATTNAAYNDLLVRFETALSQEEIINLIQTHDQLITPDFYFYLQTRTSSSNSLSQALRLVDDYICRKLTLFWLTLTNEHQVSFLRQNRHFLFSNAAYSLIQHLKKRMDMTSRKRDG